MNDRLSPSQIARDAEVWQPQILNIRATKGVLEFFRRPAASGQRHNRHCVIKGGRKERSASLVPSLLIPTQSILCGDEGSHTGAPHQIDGDPRFLKRADDAKVRIRTGATPTEH